MLPLCRGGWQLRWSSCIPHPPLPPSRSTDTPCWGQEICSIRRHCSGNYCGAESESPIRYSLHPRKARNASPLVTPQVDSIAVSLFLNKETSMLSTHKRSLLGKRALLHFGLCQKKPGCGWPDRWKPKSNGWWRRRRGGGRHYYVSQGMKDVGFLIFSRTKRFLRPISFSEHKQNKIRSVRLQLWT